MLGLSRKQRKQRVFLYLSVFIPQVLTYLHAALYATLIDYRGLFVDFFGLEASKVVFVCILIFFQSVSVIMLTLDIQKQREG